MSRKEELVSAWLTKAEHDLASAKLLIANAPPILDVAVYHCQQAAEKALKGYLTARDTIFPKTHQLGELLNLCLPIDSQCEQFRQHAEVLSPLAHQFRYPGDAVEPSAGEANQALQMAEQIYAFFTQRLGL